MDPKKFFEKLEGRGPFDGGVTVGLFETLACGNDGEVMEFAEKKLRKILFESKKQYAAISPAAMRYLETIAKNSACEIPVRALALQWLLFACKHDQRKDTVLMCSMMEYCIGESRSSETVVPFAKHFASRLIGINGKEYANDPKIKPVVRAYGAWLFSFFAGQNGKYIPSMWHGVFQFGLAMLEKREGSILKELHLVNQAFYAQTFYAKDEMCAVPCDRCGKYAHQMHHAQLEALIADFRKFSE